MDEDRQSEGLQKLAELRAKHLKTQRKKDEEARSVERAKMERRRALSRGAVQVLIEASGTVIGGAVLAAGAVIVGVIKVTPTRQGKSSTPAGAVRILEVLPRSPMSFGGIRLGGS